MKLLQTVILLSLCVLLVDSAVVGGSLQEVLNGYERRIQVLLLLLSRDCPETSTPKQQNSAADQRLQVQKQLYDQLLSELNQCRKLKSVTTQSETTTTTEVKPTTTTEVKPTTTTEVKPTATEVKPTTPQPIECQQATNYTQSWRRDHNGSDIRPGGPNSNDGYPCDLHVTNSEWFRFTGEAGNKMLDKCPKWKSCGTKLPYWTDAEMPEVVGVESTVESYEVYLSYCKFYTRRLKVMRCSRDTEHDFIYKQTANYRLNCAEAFCGMLA